MRLVVCGGRNFHDGAALYAELDRIHAKTPITLIIQGGQRTWLDRDQYVGADWLASQWAEMREIPCLRVPARWKAHGKSAGPIRNTEMADLLPDAVLATPGGIGTSDMIRKAAVRNIPVWKLP